MKLDKKQIPQLIVLGVLVILCIGYVSFKALSPKEAAAPPAPVNQAAEESTKSCEAVGDPSLASVAVDVTPTGVFPDITSVPSRRDPFMPQAMPMAEGTVNQIQPVVHVPNVKPLPRLNARKNNPWAKIQPVQPIPSFSQGAAPVVVAQPDPDPQFALTGVIRGEENVAVIRVGEKGRYIVKQGQLVEGRYRVLSVSSDSAVLAYKDRRISVKLGGVN